ncbi:MAG: phosphoribosylformylglycinamidine cyclo-ligase [Acidiferrobacteraceae bacterium]|nr:phosphoribosylformylglycinamidine cyclo-ligase [Acidiferrobacteraceae bacterium]
MLKDDQRKPGRAQSYRESGVDIAAGDRLVKRIQKHAESTRRPGYTETIGGFGGLFELAQQRYRQPVLVSGADGVGTKLNIATLMDSHDTIGIDLVAMCVNDVVVCGAEPLFFLDYIATGSLDLDQMESVISGIAEGCRQACAALIGGETAEMPGMYKSKQYDLAGFCVGVIEKDEIIDGENVKPGDQILGLASSGPHSNGYSLIRAIIKNNNASLRTKIGNTNLGNALIAPTRIYVPAILELKKYIAINAIAHITGGGIPGNVARVVKPNLSARIDSSSWPQPPIFQWLQEKGNIATQEMFSTFNCGIGLVLVVSKDHTPIAKEILENSGEEVWLLGEIVEGDQSVAID